MNNSDINDTRVEIPLKSLLEEILFFLENFIEDQNDLKLIEQQLKDYDNLIGLVSIISNLFKTLTKKVERKLGNLKNDNSSFRSIRPEEEYLQLEQIIQKHEAEIRNHISVLRSIMQLEQQMKIYTESLQQRIEDVENQLKEEMETNRKSSHVQNSLKQNLKKELFKVGEQCRQAQKENEILKSQIEMNRIIVHTDTDAKVKKLSLCVSNERNSTPLKSQSQHQKNIKSGPRGSQDQELFQKYSQMLKQSAQCISQRSQVISSSQYLKNTKTKSILNDLSAQLKTSQRSKSQQGTAPKSSNNNSINQKKMLLENTKTNEAIQKLLKLK